MDTIPISIDRGEVLRYLGYHGGDIGDKVEQQLETAGERVISVARPRLIYAVYPFACQDSLRLEGTVLCLEGEAIRTHLSGCGQVILMAATLGADMDKEIARTQIIDMGLAAIIDASADAAIEYVCDSLQARLEREFAGKFLTERFSPGYGDMPLSQQEPLCRILDTDRKIGLRVTESYIMFPRKSVTAIIGISDTPVKRSGRGCESCNLAETCAIRKAGEACGK